MSQETPEVTWLIVTTVGVLVLGAVMAWALMRYRRWRHRAPHPERPTD
jgi:hypothetical protein